MIFLNFLFLKNVFGQSSYDWPEQELHKRLLQDYEKDVRPVNLKGRYIQDSGLTPKKNMEILKIFGKNENFNDFYKYPGKIANNTDLDINDLCIGEEFIFFLLS